MVVGTKGFIAWFEALIYNKIRDACKNFYVKIFVHSIGILLMVIGIYFLITTMLSFASIAGLFLIIIGLVIFVIPLGVE
jgi:Ca2+/Na+ antiporter